MAVTITESKYGPIAQIATMAVTADKIDKRKSEYKKLVAKKIKVK